MKYKLYDYDGNSVETVEAASYAYCPNKEAVEQFREACEGKEYVTKRCDAGGRLQWDTDCVEWDLFPNGILLAMLAELRNPCVA